MAGEEQRRLRALVVDDSAYNRRTITAMLQAVPDVEVVGRAVNGKEALRLVFDLEPDVITLDLEMPEMDGFSFLRLLMKKRPTPVLVVSGYAERENVFRALELGALDFVAKPQREASPELRNIERDLAQKMGIVRKLQAVRLRDRARSLAAAVPPSAPAHRDEPDYDGPAPLGIVGIAASTGGPPAIQQLLCELPNDLPLAIMVSQHMPARFTKAFAERLDRIVSARVVEARDGAPICAGVVHIAPGGSHLGAEFPVATAQHSESGRYPLARVVPGARGDAVPVIAPSADYMFRSLAAGFGSRFCAVILTGMGSDGRDGAIFARESGAHIIAEDPSTAVMPGMPFSAVETGVVHEVVPLEDLAAAIVRFAERCKTSQ